MLTMTAVRSAADAKRYYSVADYYRDGQETVGLWGGKLAERMGLSGVVDQATFDLLCDNIDPRTGERLTIRAKDRVGYDFTFSGPKGFSIAEALADETERKRLYRAFDEAVRETMERDVEPDMQCRVRKAGADADRTTGNMAWAEYDHSTSRPVPGHAPDMHRHRHVFVFSATLDKEESAAGRDCVKAGQFGNLKRDGEYYTACFYSRLAGKLEELGYGIDRRGGKEWGLIGLPRSLELKFSKRTGEVEDEHAARLDPNGPDHDPDYRPEYKHELGAKTRSKKQKELTPEQLRKAWDAQLDDDDRAALARFYAKENQTTPEVTAAEAVRFAIEHLGEKRSVMPLRELKRTALLHGLGSVSADQVDRELPRQGVFSETIDGREMATTEAFQREEDFLAGVAAGGRGAVDPIGAVEGLTRELRGGGRLNDGQWQAVTGLLESEDRVTLLEGPAGAGKSALLAKLDEGIKRSGQSATYLATTSTAVKVLEKDGFEAATVARFLVDPKLQKTAAGGRVVIDESSLLGHRDAVRLYGLARDLDLKLIHVGDSMQHGSVDRGAFLHVLKTYGHVKPFRLTKILRQQTPEYRAATELLSQGKAVEGFQALDALGYVREIGDDSDRYEQMAAEYAGAWRELSSIDENERVLCICPTHREAKRVTDEIRSKLRAVGALGEEEREFVRLVPVDATVAERRLATTYQPGDVIQFHQNAKGGFTKGDRLIVDDPAAMPLEHAEKFSLYRPEPIALAVGDRVRFTATVKALDGEHVYRNGSAHTVAGFTVKGIRLEDGRIIPETAGHFRHGFVETSFGSQGRTVRRAILGMSSDSLPATNQEQMYVSSSRAKERMTLYTDDKNAVASAIRRSSRKVAALEIKPKRPKLLDRLRSQWEKRRRFGHLRRLRDLWRNPDRQRATVESPSLRDHPMTQPQERKNGYGR